MLKKVWRWESWTNWNVFGHGCLVELKCWSDGKSMLYRKPHELDCSVFNVVIGICKVIKCASCEFYIPK